MSLGSPAAQAIITKGLTCGRTTACQGGTMITAGPFSLYCVKPEPVVSPAATGGGHPMAPGEIGRLYQPVVQPDQYYVVGRDKEAEYLRKKVPVKIMFNMGKINVTKEYMVPERNSQAIVKVANVYNITKERISVTMSTIKRTCTKAVVSISNFRRRR